MGIPEIAERLNIHISVMENYEEEWLYQQEQIDKSFEPHESFEDFMCNVYAEAAFLIEATEKQGTVVECLGAYDKAYRIIEDLLNG